MTFGQCKTCRAKDINLSEAVTRHEVFFNFYTHISPLKYSRLTPGLREIKGNGWTHTRSSAIILILPTALKSASKNAFLGPAYCQIKQENTYQL
jgi:hypothetical protein